MCTERSDDKCILPVTVSQHRIRAKFESCLSQLACFVLCHIRWYSLPVGLVLPLCNLLRFVDAPLCKQPTCNVSNSQQASVWQYLASFSAVECSSIRKKGAASAV